MPLPTGKRAVPVVVAVAPDRRRRLSDAALVEASIAARLLGMRILTLNATVALVPAEVTAATPAVRDRPPSEDQAADVPMRSPGDARYRPLALSVLRVEGGRVVEVVDWSRPELFEGFGLPMSFPPSDRSNEDEVNAKEVR